MKPPSQIRSLDEAVVAGEANAAAGGRIAARSRLADFYELTKPRMNFLVLATTAVGYYMAVRHSFEWLKLLHTILGTALMAASAGALNQYAERRWDARMLRTSQRPLPAGRLAPVEAMLFGLLLGAAGAAYLAAAVNVQTAAVGGLTLLVYVLLYTPMKRSTSLCTAVGAVAGAMPPVMGSTAVHNAITPDAVALFTIVFFWQMPHFLAIGILCREDYAKGGFRILPVVDHRLAATCRQIIVYLLALVPATLLPAALHMAGVVYVVFAVVVGIAFLSFGLVCVTTRSREDARQLFVASILYLPLLLAVMMIDKLPPVR